MKTATFILAFFSCVTILAQTKVHINEMVYSDSNDLKTNVMSLNEYVINSTNQNKITKQILQKLNYINNYSNGNHFIIGFMKRNDTCFVEIKETSIDSSMLSWYKQKYGTFKLRSKKNINYYIIMNHSGDLLTPIISNIFKPLNNTIDYIITPKQREDKYIFTDSRITTYSGYWTKNNLETFIFYLNGEMIEYNLCK